MQNQRRGWRLSTKLTVTYSLLIILVSAVLALSLFFQLRTSQRQATRERLQDILSFAGPLVDGDYHSLILTPQDAQSSYYTIVSDRLRAIRQTSDVIANVYTVRQQPDGRLAQVFNLGGGSNSQAAIGAPYAGASALLQNGIAGITAPVVEDDLITDAAGRSVLRGFAPIYDQSRRLEGVIGIDIDAAAIRANSARTRNIAIAAFLATVPLSLLFGWWLARRLTAPVKELVSAAAEVAQGRLDQTVPVRSKDELGDLAATFNAMARSLQERIVGEQATQQELRDSNQQMQGLLDLVRDLETPVIPLLRGVLVVPLVGYVDALRAERLTRAVLLAVHEKRAQVVLVDITGIAAFDAAVAANIEGMIRSITILGSRAILTGIKAAVAREMVALGLNFGGIETAGQLEDGVARVLSELPANAR